MSDLQRCRNIAIAAGTPTDLISEVSAYMISREQIDIDTAQDYLRAHDIHIQATKHRMAKSTTPPSTLFVKLELLGSNVFLNVLFETVGMSTLQLLNSIVLLADMAF